MASQTSNPDPAVDTTPAPPLDPPSIEKDLDEAMPGDTNSLPHIHSEACVHEAAVPEGGVLVTFVASAQSVPNKGKKNTRFGRNADGTAAKKADKKMYVHKSDWGLFLADFKRTHPDMVPQDATMEAQMRYIPKNGKKKSFERIFTEVWKRYTPKHVHMTKEQKALAMREDFIRTIPIGLRKVSQ